MREAVVIGIGEMGSVFARGMLRTGLTVHPVTRSMHMQQVAEQVADPEVVLLAVAEADLHAQLETLPAVWRDRLVLLQNELLPADWQQYRLDPTVISVWFEKKKGQDSKVIIPSPVYGKHATLIAEALGSIDIATRVLENGTELLDELVIKNVYILTTNIAGLEVGGNVGQLWDEHQTLARQVAGEVIQLQQALTGKPLDSETLIDGMLRAFEGDRQHMCMGRSAPARLQRALKLAAQHDLSLSTLSRIAGSLDR